MLNNRLFILPYLCLSFPIILASNPFPPTPLLPLLSPDVLREPDSCEVICDDVSTFLLTSLQVVCHGFLWVVSFSV